MATGNKLEVQIGADVTDFQKKIKEVEFDIKELSKVKLEKIKLGLDTTQITAQIKDAKNSLNGLKTAVKDSGNSFAGAAPKIANGSNALMQFSRIAQDAPYGIIGIGNNITSTVEAFGHLKNSTGSTGGALKALASSLMGSGGILLGVSLLTTGLTLLAQSGLSIGDIIDKMTGDFNEFGGAIKKASEEGVKATAGEVFGLKALVSAAQNKALSDKERLIAVEDLQKQYPGYFDNLSKEQIMTSNLTGVVNELTKALVNRAIAEKLAGASADIQLGIYKINAGLLKQKQETLKLEKELATLVGNSTKDELYADNQKFIAVTNLNGQIRASKTAENEYRSEIVKGTKAIEQRQNVINTLTASSIKLEQATGAKTKKAKGAKEKLSLITDIKPVISTGEQNDKILSMFRDTLSEDITNFKKTPIPLKIPLQPIVDTLGIDIALQEAYKRIYDMNDAFSQTITNSISSGIANIGNAIGEALVSGTDVMVAMGSTLLQSLGSFLSDLGKQMIQFGVLGLLFGQLQLAFLFGDPYTKIGAAIALIAVGAAMSIAGGAISSSAGGKKSGSSGTSTATGSTANNTSSTSGSSGGWSGGGSGTVVFEIAGTSLIGVLNNTTQRNLRIGGK